MEKFGIFELLDALSAVVLDGEERQTPKGNDPVYAPPVYAPTQHDEKETVETTENPPQKAGSYAIDEFYRRHDSRAKK